MSIENDFFTGSDNNYTNGVSATWSSDALNLYDEGGFTSTWAGVFDFMPGFDSNGAENHISISIIHEMNTPSDITLVDPPINDQPYSGVLLVDTGLYSKFEDWAQAWNIKFGAVGPVTQADHLQTAYHELIGADEPLGWDTQLPNEPLFNVGYTVGYTGWQREASNGLDVRLSPIANVDLGTYSTSIGGALFFEMGTELEDTLGSTSLGQGLGSVLGVGARSKDQWEFSSYAGVGGYAIAHYLPLDGTVFRDSRSVESDPYLVYGSVGATARYKNWIASLGVTFGATPFEDRDDDLDYGAISIGYVF